MRHRKLEKIAKYYGKSVDDMLKDWYLNERYSAQQIVEKIKRETGIYITNRGIQYTLGKLKINRSLSEARRLGILTGRVNIDHIVPVTQGGTNDIANLRTTCSACNHGKMIYEHEK